MIQDDQVNATEESTLEVDAADGVLANDTSPNGPLTVVEGLYRTTGGGQIYFFSDGSYDYVSAPGFSGTDTVQYTALDNSNNVAGTATLTIDVAATAPLPFVSIGTQLGVRTVVSGGFPQVGNGIDTSAGTPVPLTGGGYVITVTYLDQADGATNQVQTYDANNNLLSTFDPGMPVHSIKTAALTDGDYILAWDTGANSGSPPLTGNVELFSATGAALAGPVTLELPAGADGISKIAALPGGGFVVLQEDQNGQLYAWSFNAAGVAEGQPVAIGPSGVSPALAVLPDGEIVFAQVVNGDEVDVQRYDAQGNAIGSEILPPSDGGAIDPASMSVTLMPNGGFAVSWAALQSGGTPHNPPVEETHVQLVDADGNLVGSQATRVVTYTSLFGAAHPYVTALADGGFVIYWRGAEDPDTVNEIQAYDASGNAVSGITQFPAVTAYGAVFLRLFGLPAGGFAVGPATADPPDRNLFIYDNNGDYVGDVPMEYAGDGSDVSQMFLANLPDGNTLVLYDEENDTLESSRTTVQTINFDTATPVIQTGITFNENTTGTIPVVVSIPDPDGSEVVQSIDITGIPAGWTLSDPGGSAVFDGFDWTVLGGNVTHGGEIDLSLTPPANFVGSETLTVTAHVVDTGNGSQNQSVPVTFDVTVLNEPPLQATHNVTVAEDATIGPQSAGDSDPDGDSITVTGVTGGTVGAPLAGAYGTLTINADDTFTYSANNLGAIQNAPPGTSLTDTFSYTVSDSHGASTTETLDFSINRSTVPNNFSGSGISGVLWRNTADQSLIEWQMNGSTVASSQFATYSGALVTPSSSWDVAGVGDFNDDGKTDILWQSADGSLADWTMNGAVITASDYLRYQGQVVAPDSSWSIAGIGDFNGDGDSDLLWRNSSGSLAEWLMNGSTIEASDTPAYQGRIVSPDSSWSVAAIGDFNGDGDADIIWRQSTTGELAEWQMNGATITSSANVIAQGAAVTPDSSWSIAGVGDFNGDGREDLLWRQSTTGTLAEWLMNGSQIVGSGQITYQGSAVTPDSTWNLVEVGDFNGDGKADLLWQQTTTGTLVEWQMNGAQIVSSQTVTSQGAPVAPSNVWQVQSFPNNVV